MKLCVDIFGVANGKPSREGTISWDGKEYAIDPPSNMALITLLREPVYDGRRTIESFEPEAFLKAMHRQYRGLYCNASRSYYVQG